MLYEDEKDYIMRLIRQASRVLFTILYGKKYMEVNLEKADKFEVSGRTLEELMAMADQGEINEAENALLEDLDYTDRGQVAGAALFYQYLCTKETDFLEEHDYSPEEILDGFNQVMQDAGYGELVTMLK